MGVRKMFQELEEVPMTMVGGFDVHPQQITFDYVDDEGLVHQSAGKSKSKGRGRGNPWLAGTLGPSPSPILVPTPSWVPATAAWPDVVASKKPSSLPATRC
jgi:hypothetical protein